MTCARKTPGDPWRAIALGGLIALTTAARAWAIAHCPEPDGDAKGHLGIAGALLSHPFSVAVHWVWPPGYHYLLAVLLTLGVTAHGVRLINCGFAALLPLLVWRYGERTIEPSADDPTRLVPFLAAVFCAAMPIVNFLGTSAEPGTLFAVLVLTSSIALDTNRFAAAGLALGAAAMVRYEAWGAIGLLAGFRLLGFFPGLVRQLPASLSRVCRVPAIVAVVPLVAVAGWFFAHRLSDGSWLGFVRELYRYTHLQRETFHQGPLLFPVIQPYYLFGLTLPLFMLGIRRAWRPGFVVPLGIYAFLLVSYTFKGSLASSRYYESLAPFVCLAAAHGVAVVGARWRRGMPVTFAAAFAHVLWLLVVTNAWMFRR